MRSRLTKNTSHPSLPVWLRAGVKPLLALALFLGALLFCALPSSVATNSPAWEPVAAQPADPAMLDMELTLRARKAVAEDALLSKLQLGIEVHNRVATLWGSVASKALAQQVEGKLRNGLGLAEVRNELHVDAVDEINAGPLPPLQVRAPLADEMTRDPPRRLQSVAQRPNDTGVVTSQEALWRPATPRTVTRNPNDDTQPAGMPPRADALKTSPNRRPMPLVSLPGYPAHDSPASSSAPPAPQPESTAADLTGEVDFLRAGDPRFAGIKPELRGHVVYLRGRVLRWQHLYDLAKAVSNVRGVERVVLEDVHADSND